MTTGTEPAKSPDWVSQRPFWGGLLLFLSGFELFLSSNMDLGAMQVHFGPTGFLSYLLPAMLLLCRKRSLADRRLCETFLPLHRFFPLLGLPQPWRCIDEMNG